MPPNGDWICIYLCIYTPISKVGWRVPWSKAGFRDRGHSLPCPPSLTSMERSGSFQDFPVWRMLWQIAATSSQCSAVHPCPIMGLSHEQSVWGWERCMLLEVTGDCCVPMWKWHFFPRSCSFTRTCVHISKCIMIPCSLDNLGGTILAARGFPF